MDAESDLYSKSFPLIPPGRPSHLVPVFSFDEAAVGSIGGYHSRNPAIDYHPHNIVYRFGGKIGRDFYEQGSARNPRETLLPPVLSLQAAPLS